MRTSTETATGQSQPPAPLMDERTCDWHPQRISDRKLLELQSRMERLKRLGDTFVGLSFSEEAQARLDRLAKKGT